MNRIPEIGERVRYTSTLHPSRTVTGVVRKVYGCDVAFKAPDGPRLWHAAVELDEAKPAWWPYGSDNMIAPSIAELEPLK